MWENTVESGRQQMTIWRMRITCWIRKNTNTHSEYVILNVLFHCYNGNMNAPQCYVTQTWPVLFQKFLQLLSDSVALIHFLFNTLNKKYDLVRKPSTLDALIGYFTPSHVIHQRLLLQFLTAPEDGRKKRPKHVEYYCSY